MIQTPLSQPGWYPANLPSINRRFEFLDPRETLRWGLATFGEDITLASGFGPSGIVLMHMATRIRPNLKVFYLQTDLLFPETLALRDRLSERLNITFTEVHSGLSLATQEQRHGPALWRLNPDLCCHLRKVEPLRRHLKENKAWITAIRRDQSPSRRHTPIVSWDGANQLLKLCPLAHWTREQVWVYIRQHDLPYNELHDAGYPSIGCMPCTRAVAAGEDSRAGRWAGSSKIECGIHIQPDGKIIRLQPAA